MDYSSCCHSQGSAAPPGPVSRVQVASTVTHPKDGRWGCGTRTSVSLQVKATFIPQTCYASLSVPGYGEYSTQKVTGMALRWGLWAYEGDLTELSSRVAAEIRGGLREGCDVRHRSTC